jgi:hypothetical protein
MNIEFSLMGAIVAVSWLLTLPLDSVFSILIAALVFF